MLRYNPNSIPFILANIAHISNINSNIILTQPKLTTTKSRNYSEEH